MPIDSLDRSVNQYDLFSKSLSHAVEKSFTIEAILILTLVVIALITGVVFYEIHRSNKRRKELMDLAWMKFDNYAEKLQINPNSVALLKEIVQEANLQDPESALKSPRVFEISLEKYYGHKKIESIPSKKLLEIRELRRNLHFLPLSKEIAFISTRQFDSGEKCLVQIPESGTPTHKGVCTVLSVKEREWSINRLEGQPVPEGTWACINLTRPGDAEYTIRTQILKDSEGELVLNHAIKLNRTQQRNWVRVDVSIPVEVTQMDKRRIGDIFSGKIIDMSGGGFGMVLPIELANGSKLSLDFDLPGHGPVACLLVKVVRVAGTVHSVAFDGDAHLVQEQIIQFVFEKQRQDAFISKN